MSLNLHLLTTFGFCLIAYLLGSISSAVIVCRIAGLPDPREAGSKNPGATNVLRVGNKRAAIMTLLGDVIKGVIPVLVIKQLNMTPQVIGFTMIAVFLGHLFPVFFKFKGGKGVATALGAILGLSWPIGLLLIGTWGITAFIFKISSLAALITAFFAPIYIYYGLSYQYAIFVTVISAFLFWRHKENIKRLIKRKEPKIGQK